MPNINEKNTETTKYITIIIVMSCILILSLFFVKDYHRRDICSAYTFCMDNQKIIANALKNYANDNNGDYPSNLNKLLPLYIEKIPYCKAPLNRKTMAGYQYEVSEDYQDYTIICRGANHFSVISENNYPIYSSNFGVISRQCFFPLSEEQKIMLMIDESPKKVILLLNKHPSMINMKISNEFLINYAINMQNVNVDMVKFLVENKADINCKNSNGQTPLQRAKELESLYAQPTKYPPDQAVTHKKYQEIVKILEKAGAKE